MAGELTAQSSKLCRVKESSGSPERVTHLVRGAAAGAGKYPVSVGSYWEAGLVFVHDPS